MLSSVNLCRCDLHDSREQEVLQRPWHPPQWTRTQEGDSRDRRSDTGTTGAVQFRSTKAFSDRRQNRYKQKKVWTRSDHDKVGCSFEIGDRDGLLCDDCREDLALAAPFICFACICVYGDDVLACFWAMHNNFGGILDSFIHPLLCLLSKMRPGKASLFVFSANWSTNFSKPYVEEKGDTALLRSSHLSWVVDSFSARWAGFLRAQKVLEPCFSHQADFFWYPNMLRLKLPVWFLSRMAIGVCEPKNFS